MQRLRAGDLERDEALTILQSAYEAGRLDLEEMHVRQEQALRVVYIDELSPLVGDLPESDPQLPARVAPPQTVPYVPYPLGEVPEEATTLTIMSGKRVVVPPGTRKVSNFAWWGGNVYDLTSVMGPGRIVTLHLSAVMAGHEIRVPLGVRVLDQSTAIMAGSDVADNAQGDGSNGTLVIKGFLFWAGHSVQLARQN